MAKLSERRVREALTLHRGNQSAAAEALGVARSSLHAHIQARPELRQFTLELREVRLDHAEDKLWAAVERGDVAAIRYTLTCLGRDRGWIEKPLEEATGHVHLHLSEGELVRRLQALASQMGRREPQQISGPSEPATEAAIPIVCTVSNADPPATPSESQQASTTAEPPAEQPATLPATPVTGVPAEAFDE